MSYTSTIVHSAHELLKLNTTNTMSYTSTIVHSAHELLKLNQ